MNISRDPITSEEWQEAVNMAEFLLLIHSAKLYGLISFECPISSDRCCEILQRGAVLGYKPDSEDALVRKFLVPA